MTPQTIRFGDEGQLASADLVKRFEALRPEISQGTTPAMARLRQELQTLAAIDRQHGGTGPLALEDAAQLATATIVDLAHLEHDARREGFEDTSVDLAHLALGVGLWAMRHEVPLGAEAIEHVTNALAALSNASGSKQELAAVYGLMQAFVDHLRAELGDDRARPDPRRPWRLLNVNLAVTAIRTEDPQLIERAFDQLDTALPHERAAFYAEALSIALNPQIAPVVREAIESRHKRYTESAGDLS